MKILLLICIIVTAIIPYFQLCIGIAKDKVKQNFATWLLWLILDSVVLMGIIAQHGDIALFSVFTAGTFAVTAVLIIKQQFSWKWFETLVTGLVVVCIIIYLTSGPYMAVIATTVALNIAGIPQIVLTYKDPKTASASAYFFFMSSSILAVINAPAWTVPDRLPQISAAIFCLIVFLLSLRRSKEK